MNAHSRPWFFLTVGLLIAGLVFLLKPILTPFAIAALLSYVGDPLVDWLESHRMSRTAAVSAVFFAIVLIVVLLALFFVPKLQQQIGALVRQLPRYLSWLQENVVPHAANWFGLEPDAFGLGEAKTLIMDHWQRAGGIAMVLLSDLKRSGATLAGWAANIVLIPVVTFYLLRDWDVLVKKVHDLLPRSIAPAADTLARDCDAVLGEFLRGQMLVMLVLALVYWLGLWALGLELALLIGLTAGLVSFVPYLGFIVGIVLALVAAFFQFDSIWPLAGVAAVFGVGQMLEGMLLTPMLVGDRIGLHPVAVIFAVLAGGQLFGFFGVLLALPVAAIVIVVLRLAHEHYMESELYAPD
jgi:predicted PurR-regulated permease PerM